MAEKVCGACKKYLVRWELKRSDETCPKAEYKDHKCNASACLPTDPACDLYIPKFKPKLEEPNMSEALELLNKHNYKCPTDTEKVLVYNQGTYEPAKSLIFSILEKEYGDNLKQYFVNEAYAHIQRANYIDRAKINQFINKIPIKNGIFNLVSRMIEPFDPKQVFTFKLNVKYDSEAKCPKWLEFVKQVVSEDDILLLQEIMGYCLLPSVPYHKMFWLYGTGRNGKGVVVRTLEHILGQESCSNLNLSEFRESRRFSLAQLYGKLLNVSSEPQLSKYGLPTAILKMVTGQDTISAELKKKNERLVFKNFAKVLVLGNHFPKVEDNSLGWWDRVIVLNFPNSFEGEQCIPNIENCWLPEETSGIFNWILDGLYRIRENNGFSSSKTAEETKTEFMKVSDPFNAWIIEKCIKIQSEFLTRDEALTAYFDYCDEIGADRDSKRMFYEKMRHVPQVKDIAKKVAGKTERVFHGITLKIEDEIQTNLDKVAKVAEVTGSHIKKILTESKKEKEEKTAISATSVTFDVYSLFPKGKHPICFSCHKPIVQLEFLTNIDGRPIHKSCKQKIEAQKKEKDSKLGVNSW